MSEPQPIGSREELRLLVCEMAMLLRIQCEVLERFAELGDDAGLEYTTRRALAYIRVIAATVRDLRPIGEPEPPDADRLEPSVSEDVEA